MLTTDANGLYCAAGDFYIDPWRPVPRSVITHAHGDHARPGCGAYLAAARGEAVLRERVGGAEATIETLAWGEPRLIGPVRVSLHPAGHLLGSAQVRVEHRGEVWVVSGDYKLEPDATCDPFEPVRCDTFITESTFGLPVYRWRPQAEIFAEIHAWWRANQAQGRTTVIFAYALGKAQRVLAGLAGLALPGPIVLHGAVSRFIDHYRAAGVAFPDCHRADAELAKQARGRALVIAPPSADHTPWLRKFGPVARAFASGWMQVRGARRRRALDRGFALSDHADWDGLNAAVAATGARRVLVTHGHTAVFARWLGERGYDAGVLTTRYDETREEQVE